MMIKQCGGVIEGEGKQTKMDWGGVESNERFSRPGNQIEADGLRPAGDTEGPLPWLCGIAEHFSQRSENR
jgi:hypothetical protein